MKELRSYDEILAKRNETRIYLANHGHELSEQSYKAMTIKAETLEWVLKMQ